MKQTERIKKMEERFNRAVQAIEELAAALEKYKEVQPDLKALERYYDGGEWQKDYETDEAGLLPQDLKRGVLSEDAVWNLLSDRRELLTQLEALLEVS